ncbi:EF-hand calcium-binding domain-containing protein 5 [Phlyctochytrium planicorne]|nr:EF-hand calcium-binding domain-containing protein 5 [Phlyctochytrium planicorne]
MSRPSHTVDHRLVEPGGHSTAPDINNPNSNQIQKADAPNFVLDRDAGRDIAVAALTNDFLNVSDMSLDLRTYLVETTLPSTVLALEKLIKEVERRGLLQEGAALTPAGGVALAAEDSALDIQPDKPLLTTFNPINWLAQYLYRNNPRYSNFVDPLSAPYISSMNQIGDHLKARLFELHTSRRARLHAEELARKREDERTLKALYQKQEEKRLIFVELLATVFRKWSLKNWRMNPGFLLRSEIVSTGFLSFAVLVFKVRAHKLPKKKIEAHRAILQADIIQSDDSLIAKVSALLNAYSMSPEASEKARMSQDERQRKELENTPATTSLWRGSSRGGARGIFGPKGFIPSEFLSAPKWTLEMFIDSTLFVMDASETVWTQEELGTYLKALSAHLDERFERLLADFKEALVVPKFANLGEANSGTTSIDSSVPTTPGAPPQAETVAEFSPEWSESIKEEWRKRLGKLVEGLLNGEEIDPDIDITELKANMLDYCSGEIKLDHAKPSSAEGSRAGTANSSGAVLSWRTASAASSGKSRNHSADPFSSRSQKGDMITSSVLPSDGTSTESSEEDVKKKPDNVITLAGVVAEVEEEYKTYLRIMIGLEGLRPFKVLMSYLSKAMLDQAYGAPGTASSKDSLTEEDRFNSLLTAFGIFIGEQLSGDKPTPEETKEFLEKLAGSSANLLQLHTAIDLILEQGGRDLDVRLRTALENLRKIGDVAKAGKGEKNPETLLGKEFATSGTKACEVLDDRGFRELEGILRKEFQEAYQTFSSLLKGSAGAGTSPGGISAADRERIERRALSEIARLGKRPTITLKEAADESINVLATAMTSLHPSHVVRGRLAIVDQSSPTDSTGSPASPGSPEKSYRFVGCTPDIRASLMNSPLPFQGDLIESKVLRNNGTLKIDTGEDNELVMKVDASSPVSPTSVSKFVGVPMISPVRGSSKAKDLHPNVVGMVGLTLNGDEDGGFNEADVKFVEAASSSILQTLDKIDRRLKAIALAESSLKYAREMGDAEVNIYLNEPDTWEDAPKFFKVESYDKVGFMVEVEEGGKSTQQTMAPRVSPMAESDPVTDLLVQAATEMDMIDFAEEDGRITTYIPVIDEHNHVVAVMAVRVLPGKNGEMPPEDLDDVRRITGVLSTAMNQIGRERLGDGDEFSLEGERIDSDARRTLLFSKMMLLNARELLGKLDNRALAELRSYKKPPPIIHKVIKAVLYVFGRGVKELQSWMDTVKLVNADMLKTMIAYDPTGIQKKIRFKRCHRVLKKVPRTDVKAKGSMPTSYMHEWLLISLELRRLAVEARNRRPDVYQALQQQIKDEDEEEDDDEEADGSSIRSGSAGSRSESAKEKDKEKREGGDTEGASAATPQAPTSASGVSVGGGGLARSSPSRSSLKNLSSSSASTPGGGVSGSNGELRKTVQFADEAAAAASSSTPPS